ncbi:hypothetical protein K458DRAFT_422005 [Lentithecium fluviatile CBS 122367]|uniref:Uncharacterized protein n=1 Tax=Lentithecium fluviatile CBS 122367 TaxID=1168545 RepID=A0A6G1IP06_9PLEO|nr:hypothetical protein K458DRAFT_422005 [Lentithecium fluviatile CBS 122367]
MSWNLIPGLGYSISPSRYIHSYVRRPICHSQLHTPSKNNQLNPSSLYTKKRTQRSTYVPPA